MELSAFNVMDERMYQSCADIWNAACGADLAISSAFIAYNLRPSTGIERSGQIAWADGKPVGFVFVGAPVESASTPWGWLECMAVHPDYQKSGIGSALLTWAENWLRAHSVRRVHIAAGLRPFAAGLPEPLQTADFFQRRGYQTRPGSEYEWDVARDLSDYTSVVTAETADLRLLQPGEEEELLDFLRREFPGRWLYEVQEYFKEGGRPTDYLVLRTAQTGLDGFCWLTFEDSVRPLERFYMHRLPRPWGQIGPLGVGKACRGQGLGAALIDAAICHVQQTGVRGCVIDWTSLLNLYARFGFQPYRKYTMLAKSFEDA
jgi:GNAT superfamily N-acetyltransferase